MVGKSVLIHYCSDQETTVDLLIEQSIQGLRAITGDADKFQQLVIRFSHSQYYLPRQPSLELVALIDIKINGVSAPKIEGSIFVCTAERLRQLQSLSAGGHIFKDFCRQHSLPWLVMSAPWLFAPVYVPKPWGQEIWYTGIEARGQAAVVGEGGNIPLPWLLELMSVQIGLADKCKPILLKVLDPLADEVYGDLYFELHQEKQEVYVVTHIDLQAWPTGVGAVQLGLAVHKRQGYQSDNEFKQAYLDAVTAYEQVRRLLDLQLDQKKVAAGIGLNQPVASSRLISWIGELSQLTENKELIAQEMQLRQAMNSFVAEYPLVVGDVVNVPKLVPHALQHGVRVVEFQTPVYERKILSFGQKVLTQSHWDTAEALDLVELDVVQLPQAELLGLTAQARIERIVNFDEFEVQRIQLNGSYLFCSNDYAVVMVIQGCLALEGADMRTDFSSGQALLIPKSENGWTISSSTPCILLIAKPH